MKNSSQLLSRVVLVVGIALGGFGLAALANWTDAPLNPPANNADAPVNVTYGSQTKQGGLWLKGLTDATHVMTYGLTVENAPINAVGGLVIPTGAGLGKVLVSNDTGVASWGSVSGGGGASNLIFFKYNSARNGDGTTYGTSANGIYTWQAPTGVSKVYVRLLGGGGGGGGRLFAGGCGVDGAGGGGGGYGEGYITETAGTTYTITVGNGGAGAGPVNYGCDGGAPSGTNGGTSSFGTLVTSTGGGGGTGGCHGSWCGSILPGGGGGSSAAVSFTGFSPGGPGFGGSSSGYGGAGGVGSGSGAGTSGTSGYIFMQW